MFGRKRLLAGFLLLLALAPVGALAVDIKTQSSTQYLWYNDPFQDKYFTNITRAAELRAAYNYRFVSSDPGAHVHNWRYAAQLLYDSAYDLDNTVVFPGNKADFFR